jgi:hypothetical protein
MVVGRGGEIDRTGPGTTEVRVVTPREMKRQGRAPLWNDRRPHYNSVGLSTARDTARAVLQGPAVGTPIPKHNDSHHVHHKDRERRDRRRELGVLSLRDSQTKPDVTLASRYPAWARSPKPW